MVAGFLGSVESVGGFLRAPTRGDSSSMLTELPRVVMEALEGGRSPRVEIDAIETDPFMPEIRVHAT